MRRSVAVTSTAAAGLCAALLGLTAFVSAAAGPDTDPNVGKPPKPLTVPLQWELKIDIERLRCLPMRLPGEKRDQLFWYLRYTVTNLTDEDHVFVPEFILYTETGQVSRAGKSVPTAVFYKIKKLHEDPLLKTQTSVTRKILRGRDNAKSGAAIWPDFDPNCGVIDIFIGGLSGETKTIPLPKPVKVVETDYLGNKKTVTKNSLILTKTLQLRYLIAGEKAARRRTVPKLLKKQWVMR